MQTEGIQVVQFIQDEIQKLRIRFEKVQSEATFLQLENSELKKALSQEKNISNQLQMQIDACKLAEHIQNKAEAEVFQQRISEYIKHIDILVHYILSTESEE